MLTNSQNNRSRLVVSVLPFLVFIATSTVFAKGSWVSTWQGRYPDSLTDNYVINGTGKGCVLCHYSGTNTFNAYGWDVFRNLNLGLSGALQAVESLDSDRDPTGATNLAEILGNSQPGFTEGPTNTVYDQSGPVLENQLPPEGILGSLDPTPLNPQIDVDPPAVDFGEVALDATAASSVLLSNVGDAELVIEALILSGSSGFSLPDTAPVPPLALASGTSTEVPLSFRPLELGPHSGELQIRSNDSTRVTLSVPLAGIAVPAPVQECNIVVEPLALDFGSVETGGTRALAIVVSNNGTADCMVGAPAVQGSTFFHLSAMEPFTLPSGGSRDLLVEYAPVDEGEDTASLLITSNDQDEPLISVALTGLGVAPQPEVVDLDITALRVSKRVSLRRGNPIKIVLVIVNRGTLDEPRDVTIKGVMNDETIYDQSLMVSAPVGSRRRYSFNVLPPDVQGEVTWTAVVLDDDPTDPKNTAVGTTLVVR